MSWRSTQHTEAARARKREYNSREYKQRRAAEKLLVDRGYGQCWRPSCRRPIPPGSAWHLGHDDWDRSIIRGAECVDCNMRHASSKGGRVAKARRNATQPARNAPKRRLAL